MQSQERTSEDILANIEYYTNNIKSKSVLGQSLSRGLTASVEKDKYLKLQRYEIFIDKMQRLYKYEIRFRTKMEKKFLA